MAIRIRTVKGVTVALCAAETDAKPGDIYLDDNAHHALSTKFGLDWKEEGLLHESLADPVLVRVMKKEKVRDARKELEKEILKQRRKGTRAEPSPIRTKWKVTRMFSREILDMPWGCEPY